MSDVLREACFNQKIFTNELNIGLPLQTWVEKIIFRMETHWFPGKEKVLGAVVSQEGHAHVSLCINALEKGMNPSVHSSYR